MPVFISSRYIIELSLGSTYRYTDIDMDVVYNGNTYYSRGIEFDAAQYSLLPKVDNLTFEIDNVGLEMSALVMNTETRGKQCIIYRVAFDDYLQVIGITSLFIGYLDKIEINHQRGRFEVYNQFIKWHTPTPRRTYAATCDWIFKDTNTCRYSGSSFTNCDKSWDACVARSNTQYFGNFRWLPSFSDAPSVKWGRT